MDIRTLRQTLEKRSFSALQPAIQPIASIRDKEIPAALALFETRQRDLFDKEKRGYFLLKDDNCAVELEFLRAPLAGLIGMEPLLVVSDDDAFVSQLSSIAPHAESLRDANALMHRLVSFPKDLWESALRSTRTEFIETLFTKTYQPRSARIVNAGGADWLKGKSTVALDTFFDKWCDPNYWTGPLLLLGNRGSGKTWELLHFVCKQAKRHKDVGWTAAPPLYLALSELRRYFSSSGAHIPSLSRLLIAQYSEIDPALGPATFDAMFDSGHIVACLDGVDEIVLSPSDDQISQTFWRLISEASSSARMVLTSRDSHFQSINELLKLPAWGNGSVRDHFTVLSLESLSVEKIHAVLKVVEQPSYAVNHALSNTAATDTLETLSCNAMVSSLMSHPAVLAQLAAELATRHLSPDDWATRLFSVIDGVFVTYNLENERTNDVIESDDHQLIRLGAKARHLILEEFAQGMAIRGLDQLDPALVAMQLHMLIGATASQLVGEFRAQSVLELVRYRENVESFSAKDARNLQFGLRIQSLVSAEFSDPANPGILRSSGAMPNFLPIVDSVTSARNSGGAGNAAEIMAGRTSERRELRTHEQSDQEKLTQTAGISTTDYTANQFERLRTEALQTSAVGVTSAAGAFYLAKWVFRRVDRDRLAQARELSDLDALEELLSVYGLFPLGPLAGSVLTSLLREKLKEGFATFRAQLDAAASAAIRGLAQDGNLRVFSPRLRYLAHNMEAIGIWSTDKRLRLDPWTDEIVAHFASTNHPQLKMVLVPPVQDNELLNRIGKEGFVEEDEVNARKRTQQRPYLLGVTEVTNREFATFLSSPGGQDWRIDRVTRAGGEEGTLSTKAAETNEYHLYHWRKRGKDGFTPPHNRLDHPVTYVSWYAAQAYCKWLTEDGNPGEARPTVKNHYRLPTSAEWLWVAKDGFSDVGYPWELYGGRHGALLPQGNLDVGDRNLNIRMDIARQRERFRGIIEDDSKYTRPVGVELLPSFGAFGLVGNVKEWVYDEYKPAARDVRLGSSAVPARKTTLSQRLILGGSSNLGETSFGFDYFSFLFPQNTNPDVGFRICREATDTEATKLETRERQLATSLLDD